VRQQIIERAQGNPLFAVELSALHSAAGQGQGTCHSDLVLEPGGLNSVLSRRLDALGDLKPLAQAAATLGTEFEPAVLAAVLQMDEAQLMPGITQLVDRGCLIAVQSRRGTSYRFGHALLRDAAHASILKSPGGRACTSGSPRHWPTRHGVMRGRPP
jgi:predicted ATPase